MIAADHNVILTSTQNILIKFVVVPFIMDIKIIQIVIECYRFVQNPNYEKSIFDMCNRTNAKMGKGKRNESLWSAKWNGLKVKNLSIFRAWCKLKIICI